MKKVLLLSAAVCMALTMSAQKLPTTQQATLSADKTISAPTMFGQSYAQKVLAKTLSSKKTPAKASAMPAIGSLTGLYICDNREDGDGSRPYLKSKSFSMEQLEDIVILEGGTEAEPVDYNCNVLIKDLMIPGTEIYAVYSEAEGTITIPDLQIALSEDYDYYFVNLMSINEEDKVEMSFVIPVEFAIEEDDNGFYFVNNSSYIGFGLVVFDETGQPIGFGSTCMNDVTFTPCNYICKDEERNPMSSSESSPWETADPYGVFIESIGEDEFAIHGFMECGTVRATFDEEGAGTIEALQPLVYAKLSQTESDYIGPIRWVPDNDGYINADSTFPYINCGFYNFTMTDQETGAETLIENCFALYHPETKWEYYSLGRAGMQGGYAPLTVFTLFQPIAVPALGEIPEAIKNATATRVSLDSFNLAGQRVNKTAKGIVIENNKKVIR